MNERIRTDHPNDWEWKLMLYPDAPDQDACLVGFAWTRDEAIEQAGWYCEHLARWRALPVQWDVEWPVPAAVLRTYKNGSARIRADCFETETSDGGAWLKIVRIPRDS